MIIIYLLFVSFSTSKACMSKESGPILGEQKDLCLNKTDVNKMMSSILDEIVEMKECLLRREENNTDIDSISACTAAVEESIKEARDLLNLEPDYHPGIQDPGKRHQCQDLHCIWTCS